MKPTFCEQSERSIQNSFPLPSRLSAFVKSCYFRHVVIRQSFSQEFRFPFYAPGRMRNERSFFTLKSERCQELLFHFYGILCRGGEKEDCVTNKPEFSRRGRPIIHRKSNSGLFVSESDEPELYLSDSAGLTHKLLQLLHVFRDRPRPRKEHNCQHQRYQWHDIECVMQSFGAKHLG